MTFTVTEIILLFSIFQFVFLCFSLLISKKHKDNAVYFLILFIFSKAICFSEVFVWKFSNYNLDYLHLVIFTTSFDLVLGPALYLYLRQLIFTKNTFNKNTILHLIPFFIYLIGFGTYFQFNSAIIKQNILQQSFSILDYFTTASYGHFIIYSCLGIKEILYYETFIKTNSSESNQKLLTWIKFLLGGFIIIWLLNIIQILTDFGIVLFDILWTTTVLSIFLFINALVFLTIKFPNIFFYKMAPLKNKYEKTFLTETEVESYSNKLIILMSKERLFLNKNLDLKELSKALAFPTHTTSQILNRYFKQNFYDFINSYRVNESIRLFEEDYTNQKTILEIAYKSGFSSKSSFNEAFKKNTSTTPSNYRKQILRKNST